MKLLFFFFFFPSTPTFFLPPSQNHSLARLAQTPAAGHPPPSKQKKPSSSLPLSLSRHHVLAHAPALAPLVGCRGRKRRERKHHHHWICIDGVGVVDPEIRLVVPGLPVDQRLFHGHGRRHRRVGCVGAGLGAQGLGFRELGGRVLGRAKVKRNGTESSPATTFSLFLTLSNPPCPDIPTKNTDATTTEKALPSPATSLGRVDGRRSLDSVLSNTSVFGGGGGAAGAAGGSSLASSPLSSPLSSRASLDSARGSADVRALLWRASMPGKCVFCRSGGMDRGESERKAANIARGERGCHGLTWQKEPKLSSREEVEIEHALAPPPPRDPLSLLRSFPSLRRRRNVDVARRKSGRADRMDWRSSNGSRETIEREREARF